MRKRKKKNYYEKRAEKIKKIFDFSQQDTSYISNDKSLLIKHARFIAKAHYTGERCMFKDYENKTGVYKGMKPKLFCGFYEMYPNIYERWCHMIRSCFDESYPAYQFIGAKGVTISSKFLDSKFFCVWCLHQGLNSKLGEYKQYFQRKNKDKMYSPGNCYVISEHEIHKCKTVQLALSILSFIKTYEEYHDKSVSYMTAYTRYFCYDLPAKGAASLPCIPKRHGGDEVFCFKPVQFYKSVANDESCSMSTFLSRIHYSYLNGKFSIRPYDMLKIDYSVNDAANAEGKLSYKQWWERKRKENESQSIVSSNSSVYSNDQPSIYTDNGVSSVYSN